MWKLPSISYGEGFHPTWGPVTATINWCEEDYVVTTYCAELINSITNAMFIYVSAKGIWNCIGNDHSPVFLLTWISFLLVGLGSFMFHSTLWYSMQLVDELSMINTTLIMWFATFGHKKSRIYTWALGLMLFGILITVAGIYLYLEDPTFHQNAYAILTVIVLARSWYQVHTQIKHAAPEDYNNMRDMVLLGLGSVGLAFTLWSLDTMFCRNLILLRRQLGMPWGFLLEGHAHWHLLTGLGGYYYITYGVYLRYCLENRQNEYEFVWPSKFTSLPYVRKRKNVAKAQANGTTDKKNL
ncbi:ceramidase [Kalaharituber pfeilii]|nr:ceramidase [Kalaharituber pfeilii]